MAVNEPSPRAQPENKVCLRCHKSLATRAITVMHVAINEMPHSPPPGSRWGLVRLLTISLGRRGGALVYFFRL